MLPRVVLVFLLAISIVSCDPTVAASFTVAPISPPAARETEAQEAVAIAATLAARHGLRPRSSLQGRGLAAYFAGIYRSPTNELNFSVSQAADGTIQFTLTEAITTVWSSKGDSLRQELRDTLSVRFPSRLEER
jgi:hypothetical protein